MARMPAVSFCVSEGDFSCALEEVWERACLYKNFMIISSGKVLFPLYLVHTPVKEGKRPKKPWVRKHYHSVCKEKQFVPWTECISVPL